jgi:error-prone DNA polymerase
MTLPERLEQDILGVGMTLGRHPMALYRPALAARGVKRAADLERLEDRQRVTVAGAVICRQRPGTAKGFLFLTLEDETGLVNVTVRPDLFESRHKVLVTTAVLEIEGILQSYEGISVRATEIRPAGAADVVTTPSRDFR